MAIRKIGTKWYVDFYWKYTRYRHPSPLNTKTGASEYELLLRSELARNGDLSRLDPRNRVEPPTYAEFAARWVQDYVVPNNKPSEQRSKLGALRRYLLPAFGDKLLTEIKTREIDELRAKLLATLSAKSVNNVLGCLRRSLVIATEWEVIERTPLVRRCTVPPSPFTVVSDQEAAALLQCSTPILRAMIATALQTGMRLSELVGLQWNDIDFHRQLVTVQRGVVMGVIGSPKNNRFRQIILTNDLASELQSLPRRSIWVFGRTSSPLGGSTAARWLSEACLRAGTRHFGWHAFRHTFATNLVSGGAPIVGVQSLLGHSTVAMTQRYAHVTESMLRSSMALLKPLNTRHPAVKVNLEAVRSPNAEAAT